MRMKRYSLLLTCLMTLSGSAALAQTAPPSATTQPTGTFTVQQWAVFVLDATQGEINPNGLVGSTLPEFVVTRRTSLSGDASNLPQPVGIIRLFGKSDSKVDITIGKPLGGDFLSTWPPGEARSNQMLWRDLTLSDQGPAGVETGSETRWFFRLRRGNSASLATPNGAGEQFLLFDITMPYVSALKVKTGKDLSVQMRNTSKATLHDLALYYEKDSQTWLQAPPADLPPESGATAAPPVSAAVSAPQPPATQPGPATIQLAAAPGASPKTLADAWKPRLLQKGLAEADCDMMVSDIAVNAFDGPRLTAVYLMDDAELERLMPMEVVPEPRKIIRVALVIIKNVDPTLGSDIDDLIAQLGDPVWANREAAFKSLERIGRAAESKLTQAESNPDAEIAWRAERLLAELAATNGQ
jgi:hypothetical protein